MKKKKLKYKTQKKSRVQLQSTLAINHQTPEPSFIRMQYKAYMEWSGLWSWALAYNIGI